MNLIGEHVGNYVVTRELGAGGMGTVYLAEHPVLGRKVAIKVLHDEHAANPETVARFFQEARAAAEIGEEHIIEVIDFGEVTVKGWKAVYLMMEALDGMSLGKRIERGPMPAAEVGHVALQVCLALEASHAKGIIHRDLKPENIYLCPRPSDPLFAKVLDFGIAKLTGPTKASAHTRMGTVLGTPAYMSPEQCLGQGDIDGRADVYALGVVLFELLTTQLPFSGSFGELLEAHLTHPPDPPSRRNPAVPPVWDAIVLHCLEKAREDRFPSISALAAAIRDPDAHLIAYQQQVAGRATRPPGARRTAVLPDELRPDRSVPEAPYSPPAIGADLAHAPTVSVTPTPPPVIGPPPGIDKAIGGAATFSVTPTPAPFTGTPPQATPGPFQFPPLVAPYGVVPTPVPPVPDVVPHRGASSAWIAAAALVVTVAVFAIVTLVQRRSDETRPAPAPAIAPVIAIDAAMPRVVPPPDAAVRAAVLDAMVAAEVPSDAAELPIDAEAFSIDAAPSPIEVTITSTPSDAHVTVRRGTLTRDGVTPYVVELPPGPEPASITVTAPGYVSVTRTLVPRVNVEVVVVLQRAPVTPPRPHPHRTNDDLIRP